MMTRHRQRGLTLLELSFGLASLSVLGLATSSVMMGAGNAWQSRDAYRDQVQAIRATTTQVMQWVRQSQRIVSVAGDHRYVDIVLWMNDDADAGRINLGELKVLTYDEVEQTLTLYQAAASANNVLVPAVVGSQSFGPSFRARHDVQGYRLANGVVGFNATATNGLRTGLSYRYLHMELRMRSATNVPDQTVLVAAAVRAPNTGIDFLGETELDAEGQPIVTDTHGLSIGLGVGVLGVNVNAAVSANPSSRVASVFVGLTP